MSSETFRRFISSAMSGIVEEFIILGHLFSRF